MHETEVNPSTEKKTLGVDTRGALHSVECGSNPGLTSGRRVVTKAPISLVLPCGLLLICLLHFIRQGPEGERGIEGRPGIPGTKVTSLTPLF